MSSQDWLEHFRQNKINRRKIAWNEGVNVAARVRKPLAKSFATFQLGERSEGKRLLAGARRYAARSGDPDYAEAMKLFIAEEHEHARLLANAVRAMAAPLAKRHWAEGIFHLVRNVYGYFFEVTVLLMAEIIALQYFHIVRRCVADRTVESLCGQILYDEVFHIRFHCQYLHKLIAPKPAVVRAAYWWGLAAMYAGASAVVAWDNRVLFAGIGCTKREFVRDTWCDFAAARQAMFTGEPFEWCVATGRPALNGLEGRSTTLTNSPARTA